MGMGMGMKMEMEMGIEMGMEMEMEMETRTGLDSQERRRASNAVGNNKRTSTSILITDNGLFFASNSPVQLSASLHSSPELSRAFIERSEASKLRDTNSRAEINF